MLGLPAIAVSQQSTAREMDFRLGRELRLRRPPRVHGALVEELDDVPLPDGHAAEHQRARPASPTGVEVTRLGKRIYRDELELDTRSERRAGAATGSTATTPATSDEAGTDLAAVADGRDRGDARSTST